MARLVLALAVLAVSTSAPLIRYADPAPPLTVAAFRVCLAGLFLSIAAPRAWLLFVGLPRREKIYIVTSGLLLGAHFGTWITSLYLTSTAASVALVATQPIFAALFASALGDRITRQQAIGIAVAGLGCAVLAAGDITRDDAGMQAIAGDALALLGAATAAGYLVVGRRMRVSMPLTPYLAVVNTVAGAGLLVVALCAQSRFIGFPGHVYLACVLVAVVPSLIGHSLLNWSVRRTPTHLVSLAVLGEPIGASLLTWHFFAEVPPTHSGVGGAVILAGIFVAFIRRPSGEKSVRTNVSEKASTSSEKGGTDPT